MKNIAIGIVVVGCFFLWLVFHMLDLPAIIATGVPVFIGVSGVSLLNMPPKVKNWKPGEQTMKLKSCPLCGDMVKTDWEKCPNCGEPLDLND